MLERKGWYGC